MSGTTTPIQPTTPAFPSTGQLALNLLALLGAQSGVLTDYNPGSIVRTLAESLGSVIELQGLAEQTYAFQSMVYGAMAALGIVPRGAQAASGSVQFTSPGPATQAVLIPAGTLLQTAGGIQFQTVASVALASGSSTVSAGALAVSGGTTGNVPASGITAILSSLAYPLTVLNPAAMTGGSNAESLAGTLSRFAAALATPGLASPVAVADGSIGLAFGSEVVKWASCYEPWVAAGTGVGSGTAGFSLYIDDGTGSASAGLIAVVASAISGSQAAGAPGFRPVGVPYSVLSTAPVFVSVLASGSLLAPYAGLSGSINSAISGAILTYAAGLPIGASGAIYQGSLAAVVGDAGAGQLGSLSVSLGFFGGASGQTAIVPAYSGRVIVESLTVAFA